MYRRVARESPHGDGSISMLERLLPCWQSALTREHGNPVLMFAAAALLFPKLALGLSGFETGVLVMPLIRGDPSDTPERPLGRIRNGRKLLAGAASIMSVMLLSSAF